MAQGQVVGCDGNEIWWACINRGDFLIEVYRRVSEDWRYYDRLLWEVPFGTIAGSSLVVALTKLLLGDEAWMSIAVLLALQILILVMTHLTIKVRYFSIERAECVKEIERNCIETFIPYETREAWRRSINRVINNISRVIHHTY
ncbi:hypothetical protein [Vulcanisaeta sp. JCM 16161]|uniref:hypothetical protein n=1 Tax=Vulcanisaeta sp. JCM 16161 TaxID=1295372 RepID=UPI0006D2ADCF|nr:hypothetical protein [Vulcanisaeta sp. JCM 16161]